MSTTIYNPSHLNGCPAQSSWTPWGNCHCSQIIARKGHSMSYSVKYSARQNSWFIEVDGGSDDLGTSLYDTEEEAYGELAQMIAEGLIDVDEVKFN